MKLAESIDVLPGIGPKRAKTLADHGIKHIEDLLYMLPKDYIDRNHHLSLAAEAPENGTYTLLLIGKPVLRRIRKNLSLLTLKVGEVQADGKILSAQIVFFNQPYLNNRFAADSSYYFYGKVIRKNGQRIIYNPQFCNIGDSGDFFALTPVYKKMEKLPDKTFRGIMEKALSTVDVLRDPMPEAFRQAHDLLPLSDTLKKIHQPQTLGDVESAGKRLRFDEALKINLGILSNRLHGGNSEILLTNPDAVQTFVKGLPFRLTGGQKRVLRDIIDDLSAGKTMNRLVQGDVGSGKTVIAMAVAYLMALEGYQTAYMAPTEILAEQHGRNFRKMLKPYGIEVAVITGQMNAGETRTVKDAVARGNISIIVGTHALIQEATLYYNLGLVITDEQHRFGVRQRAELSGKGEMPHTLVMSATPIPRSLSLVLYGDLDVSYIDELPKGRKKIKTYFYREKALPKIIAFMEKEMSENRQAFVICPFIEASEEMEDVADVETVCAELTGKMDKRYRVAALHSRLGSDEKEQVIADFNKGDIDLLVATSIIEVGIDVPNVSVITILSADRFGLSQLHQLRGRVGRGDQQSYCFLVSNGKAERTLERMKVIVNCHDGRTIAENDFNLRGPGDYFGLRQHGLPEKGILNPYEDVSLIEETREVALTILQSKQKELMIYREQVLSEFNDNMSKISMT